MWPYSIVAALTLIGLAMVWRGLRNRAIDDHPLCRRCRYDLSGTPSLPERCPECGRAIGGRRTIRIGNRRRRPAWAIVGLVITLASGALIGLQAKHDLRDVDWMAVRPLWWLKIEARSGSQTTATAALDELWKRLTQSELNDSQRNGLIELAIDRVGDRTTEWNPGWADLINVAIEAEFITDDQLKRYLRNYPGLVFEAKSPVRSGGIIRFNLRYDERRYRKTRGLGHYVLKNQYLETITFNGETRPLEQISGARFPGGDYGWRADLPPGTYPMTARFWVGVHFGLGSPSATRSSAFGPPDHEWQEQFDLEIEVLPADQPLVRPDRATDDIERAVRDAITVVDLNKREQGPGRLRPWLTLSIDRAPINLAYQTLLRVDDREWPIAYFAIAAGESGTINQNGWIMDEFPPEAEVAEIILRPNLDMAETRLEQGSTFLDREIILESIPIRWRTTPSR